MATRARTAAGPRVCIAVPDGDLAAALGRALAARGIDSAVAATLPDAVASGAAAIAFCPTDAPAPAAAAELAATCARAVGAGQAVVMLAVYPPARGDDAAERAAALAYLRAHGAVLCADPDVWLETLALISVYGLPAGPRVAVVAPPRSWLALAATALAAERADGADRPAALVPDAARVGPADVALVDRAELPADAPARVGRALIVPVVGRAEHLAGGRRIPLVGLREALAAAAAAGRAAARVAAGLGPADRADADALDPDPERFARQLDQLDHRAGDHETKVLLASWGVRITRQAVATTPSAATRLAKRAGFPVQLKPWSADAPAETAGCPVETDLRNAPDVRRAFAAVGKAAGLPAGAPVIVRETPPPGREVAAELRRRGALGWTVVLRVPGAPGPVAAPGPLRPLDAERLARYVEASRSTDPEPDREALAELLLRASHMVATHDDAFDRLDLDRVVVAARGDGAVVVDARAALRHPRRG